MTAPYRARHRCVDLLQKLDVAAQGGLPAEQCAGTELALRYTVAALDSILRTHPGVAERIEGDLAKAVAAMGGGE